MFNNIRLATFFKVEAGINAYKKIPLIYKGSDRVIRSDFSDSR